MKGKVDADLGGIVQAMVDLCRLFSGRGMGGVSRIAKGEVKICVGLCSGRCTV